MSHDIHAAWASAEVARILKENPSLCFKKPPDPNDLTVFASRQGRTSWPVADGVIRVERAPDTYGVAVEFKRANEGLHGILTALGQAFAYIHLGFSSSIIVIPNKYETHNSPGEYLSDVLSTVCGNANVGVFTYEDPDPSETSPFFGKIECRRPITLDSSPIVSGVKRQDVSETQWAHLREGSSTPSAFFRYLQTSKLLPPGSGKPSPKFPQGLVLAIQKLSPTTNPVDYLSNSIGHSFHDMVWRHFWFRYVFTHEVAPVWKKHGNSYDVNDSETGLLRADGRGKVKFFSAREDSIKKRLVRGLRRGEIDEAAAWEEYAKNVRARAHSLREDIDSGLEHLGLLEEDGKPTELGYRYVDACERTGNPNTGTPRKLLGSAILNNGQLGAFLHYVYRLSDKKFRRNPMEFSSGGRINSLAYLMWVENELTNNLKVMRKVSLRGGAKRKPFQAELAILRSFGFVGGFRVGVGLEVNWPAVQEAVLFKI